MRNRFGIRVAGERDKVTQERKLLMTSEEKNFKIHKTVDIIVPVPSISKGTSWSKDVSVNLNDVGLNLRYIPAYQYRIRAGHTGRWSLPAFVSPQAYMPSSYEFPYMRNEEWISKDEFFIGLQILNEFSSPPVFDNYNYPSHEMTIHLMLTLDEMEVL